MKQSPGPTDQRPIPCRREVDLLLVFNHDAVLRTQRNTAVVTDVIERYVWYVLLAALKVVVAVASFAFLLKSVDGTLRGPLGSGLTMDW